MIYKRHMEQSLKLHILQLAAITNWTATCRRKDWVHWIYISWRWNPAIVSLCFILSIYNACAHGDTNQWLNKSLFVHVDLIWLIMTNSTKPRKYLMLLPTQPQPSFPYEEGYTEIIKVKLWYSASDLLHSSLHTCYHGDSDYKNMIEMCQQTFAAQPLSSTTPKVSRHLINI